MILKIWRAKYFHRKLETEQTSLKKLRERSRTIHETPKKIFNFFSFQASVSKFSKRQQLTDFYCNVISFLFACFAMFFTSFRRNKLKEIIS